jgi:hypothetical protein
MARTLRTQTELRWTSKEDRDVRDILHAWEAARRAKAEQEMAAAAAAHGERRFLQAPNGFGGEVGLMVHSESFHYWGQRLGYGCWSDPQFVHEYLRDNPAARVRNHSRQAAVVVPELPAPLSAARKFRKSYG